MLNQPIKQIPEEITFREIILFFFEARKIFFILSILGILCGIVFGVNAPKIYQAQALIKMAQIGSVKDNLDIQGIDVENPDSLIVRLRFPGTYSQKIIEKCNLHDEFSSPEQLADSIVASTSKGAPSIVQLKVNYKSKDGAKICAEAIFEFIQISQNQMIEPYLEEARLSLINYQDRLKRAQILISKADQYGGAVTAAYLSSREEISLLNQKILSLSAFIQNSEFRKSKLLAPVYVSDPPVFRKAINTTVIGLLAGVFFAFIFTLGFKLFSFYRPL
jgi:hypothetical protein